MLYQAGVRLMRIIAYLLHLDMIFRDYNLAPSRLNASMLAAENVKVSNRP